MKHGFLICISRDLLLGFFKVRKFLLPREGSAFVMCAMAVEEKHPRDQIEGSYVNLKGWRIGSNVQIWSRLRNNMHDSDAESIIL